MYNYSIIQSTIDSDGKRTNVTLSRLFETEAEATAAIQKANGKPVKKVIAKKEVAKRVRAEHEAARERPVKALVSLVLATVVRAPAKGRLLEQSARVQGR